jgi:pyrimidine-nucleoside phosphorylase
MSKASNLSRKNTKPSFTYLIEKKRDGGEFSEGEIRFLVDSILDDEMPEFQQAAWVMAVYFQGMSAQETATFAEEMMLSGEVIPWKYTAITQAAC